MIQATKTLTTGFQSLLLNLKKIDLKSRLLKENKNPTFFGHLFITGGSIVLIGISFLVLKTYADQKSDDWINNLEVSQAVTQTNNQLPFSDKDLQETLQAKSTELTRLKDQWKEIQKRITIHKNVMLFSINNILLQFR